MLNMNEQDARIQMNPVAIYLEHWSLVPPSGCQAGSCKHGLSVPGRFLVPNFHKPHHFGSSGSHYLILFPIKKRLFQRGVPTSQTVAMALSETLQFRR